MQVLLLSCDLMCGSKVAAGTQAAGGTCTTALSAAKLIDLAKAQPGAIIVLDLATRNYQVNMLVTELRHLQPGPQAILAFGPHVDEKQLAAAESAGCDGVYARGEFYAQMPKFFASLP